MGGGGGEERAVVGEWEQEAGASLQMADCALPRQGLRLGAGAMESVAICTAPLSNQPSLWRGC